MISFPAALTGGLIGTMVGLALFAMEYVLLRAVMSDRTKRRHQKPVFDPFERRRIAGLARFLACVPPAFALIAWYFWT